MKALSHTDAFQVLLLQAADEGRGPVLFGESVNRARTAPLPFLVGKEFPSIYLEFPLCGDPFLDVTVLYNELEPGTRIDSPAAVGSEQLLDWFAGIDNAQSSVSLGFELDTKHHELPAAAIHFQPRGQTQLVEPFCKAIGEPERAALYLDLAKRMEDYWPLSFFGLFRGRPNAPLRVCGYLKPAEVRACAQDPQHLAEAFKKTGFTAYDDAMLKSVSELMAVAPETVDFQFDVYADGSLGPTFAIDLQFGIERPQAVREAFTTGQSSQVMRLLEDWGAADERWKLGVGATFARALPIELDDGKKAKYALAIMPHWVKARWIDGALQPAKLYQYANGKILT